MNTSPTPRPIPTAILDLCAVYDDGEYGTYVHYLNGDMSVFLVDTQDDADYATETFRGRTDVSYAETVYVP